MLIEYFKKSSLVQLLKYTDQKLYLNLAANMFISDLKLDFFFKAYTVSSELWSEHVLLFQDDLYRFCLVIY